MKKIILLIFLLSLSVYIFRFQATGFGVYGDGLGYYSYDRSVFFDHDLNFSNEFNVWKHQYSKMFNQVRMSPSVTVNQWNAGSAIIWIPFFLFGHLTALLLNLLKFPVAINGYSWPYEFAVGLGNIALGVVALFLLFDLGRKYVSEKLSLVGVILLTFGTNYLFYLMYEPVTSHVPSFFLFTLFLWLWKKEKKKFWLLGLSAGLLVAVRTQDVVLVLPFLVYEFWQNKKSGLKLIMATFLAFLPQLLVWQKMFGQITKIPYLSGGSAGSFSLLPTHLWEVLFSPRHGLFLWTPLLLLGLWGIKYFKNTRLAKLLLIGFILEVLVTSSWSQWWQGASFGARFFVSSLPLFFLGIISLIERFWTSPSTPSSGPRGQNDGRRNVVLLILLLTTVYNLVLFVLFILMLVPNA